MADNDTDENYMHAGDPISALSMFLAGKLSDEDNATVQGLIADALGVSPGASELGLANVAMDAKTVRQLYMASNEGARNRMASAPRTVRASVANPNYYKG